MARFRVCKSALDARDRVAHLHLRGGLVLYPETNGAVAHSLASRLVLWTNTPSVSIWRRAGRWRWAWTIFFMARRSRHLFFNEQNNRTEPLRLYPSHRLCR